MRVAARSADEQQPRPGHHSGRQIGTPENFTFDRTRNASRGEQQLVSGGACHCNPQYGFFDRHGSQGASSAAGGSGEVFGPAVVGGPHGVLRDIPAAAARSSLLWGAAIIRFGRLSTGLSEESVGGTATRLLQAAPLPP